MKFKIKLSAAALIAVLTSPAIARAQDMVTTAVKCWNAEYVRIALSDGVKVRHKLFSSVPCKFINSLFEAWKSDIGTKDIDEPKWDVFRFRSTEKPGSHGYPAFDYLGEAIPLSPRGVGVSLTKEMVKELESGKLYLENTQTSLRHAVMILRKGKPAAEVVALSKMPKLMHEYVQSHLVLYAAPEPTGSFSNFGPDEPAAGN